MTNTPGRNGSRYRRVAEYVRTRDEQAGKPCPKCGGPLYPGLRDLNPNHPLATTCGHIVAVAHDPSMRYTHDPNMMRAEHRSCNSRDGATIRTYGRHRKFVPGERYLPDHSRQW